MWRQMGGWLDSLHSTGAPDKLEGGGVDVVFFLFFLMIQLSLIHYKFF